MSHSYVIVCVIVYSLMMTSEGDETPCVDQLVVPYGGLQCFFKLQAVAFLIVFLNTKI